MNSTITERIRDLLEDERFYAVGINFKVELRDRTEYTIETQLYQRQETPKDVTFADYIDEQVAKTITAVTEQIEKPGFYFSSKDSVSIKNSEIVKIWAEVADVYSHMR